MHRDFYVDDLMKFTESVLAGITLISTVRGMCTAGGFHLTKFISNNREVLDFISAECRSPSIVDLDIVSALPIERALGVP